MSFRSALKLEALEERFRPMKRKKVVAGMTLLPSASTTCQLFIGKVAPRCSEDEDELSELGLSVPRGLFVEL